MRISGLTVCVNYSDLLAAGLESWYQGCDKLLVVTTPEDTETQLLCANSDILVHQTDVFYRDGATFNKGAAIFGPLIWGGTVYLFRHSPALKYRAALLAMALVMLIGFIVMTRVRREPRPLEVFPDRR